LAKFRIHSCCCRYCI